jgi:hypothetical protein
VRTPGIREILLIEPRGASSGAKGKEKMDQYQGRMDELKRKAEKLGNAGVEAWQDTQMDLMTFWGEEGKILDNLEKTLGELAQNKESTQ